MVSGLIRWPEMVTKMDKNAFVIFVGRAQKWRERMKKIIN